MLVIWLKRLKRHETLLAVALAMVMGGALGNLYDEAICEAVQRPSMRFVPIKQPEQQALLALHRARQGFVKARTAQGNQLRGLLAEFGIMFPPEVCTCPG